MNNNHLTLNVGTAYTANPEYYNNYITSTSSDLSINTSFFTKETGFIKDDTLFIKGGDSFTEIKQYVPEKVYEFTFADGTIVKTVCDEEDEFDLEFAFYLALAKKIYKHQYTSIGMIDKAYQLSYTNKYIKIVKKGIKLFFKGVEENRLKQQQEKEKKERHKKYVEKKRKRAERKWEKERTQLYETIKWAIEDAKKEN